MAEKIANYKVTKCLDNPELVGCIIEMMEISKSSPTKKMTIRDLYEVMMKEFAKVNSRLDKHEEILLRHEKILLRHEEILLRHEEILKKHEEILMRHEEILLRHEEILMRHEGILNRHSEIFERNNIK
jgi:hypothetical protein